MSAGKAGGKLDTARLYQDSQHAVPDDAALASVSELVERQLRLEDEIAELDERLSAKRAEYERIRTQILPAALHEHGLSDLRTRDGSRVVVRRIVRASISKEKLGDAIAWLDANGFGDLVKHNVSANFGRGEDERARLVIDELARLGIASEDRRTVHPQTLAAFVREQDEQGHSLPDDLLGVFRAEVVKIERPR